MNDAEYERMFRLEDSYWWFVGRRRLVQALIAERYEAPKPENAPLTFLDIGCGTGAMSSRLTQWGRVVSADFSPHALHYSTRRGLKHLVGADAMTLPFAANSFDGIVAMDVLEHLPDDRAALCEFYRVLKPGGRLFATVPAYMSLWSEHDLALMHYRRYIRKDMAERLGATGFRLERLSHSMTLLCPVAVMQRRLNARKKPHDPPIAAMPMFPAPVNYLLTTLLTAENAFARKLGFPFGVTIFCVAAKP